MFSSELKGQDSVPKNPLASTIKERMHYMQLVHDYSEVQASMEKAVAQTQKEVFLHLNKNREEGQL